MGRRRSHPHGSVRHARRRTVRVARAAARVPVWFAMSGLFLLLGLMMWVTVGAIVFAFWRAIPVPLLVGVLLWAGFRFRRRRRRRLGAAGTAPLPRNPAPPPRPDLAWSRARSRFATLRGEYAAHECDP